MRRIVLSILVLIGSFHVFAQADSTKTDTTINVKRIAPKTALPRSNDHFLLQLGYTAWLGKTDAMKTKGFPRTFNAYFLFDFPFKTSPQWSVALGPGISTNNIYFDKTNIGIKDVSSTLAFTNVADSNHFKKYKLATAYLEAPLELRFTLNPADNNKSFKAALGLKVGTLLNAHTKGKTLQNSTGGTLNTYIEKENSKRFFNQNRFTATARIGLGHISAFADYSLTSLFKDAVAPSVKPLTIGITLSGL